MKPYSEQEHFQDYLPEPRPDPELDYFWWEHIYGERWREMCDRDRVSMIREKRELHDLRYQVEDKDSKVFWIRCCGAMQ